VEEGQGDGGGGDKEDEATEPEQVPSFMEALMYAHNITKRDQANIIITKRLSLFSLKMTDATKLMGINDALKNK
jgi:hypothetical protein